jgi:hypothetical protein
MTTTWRTGVTLAAAARMRRWARNWVLAALVGTVVVVVVRWTTAGATAHDWEPPVWVMSVTVVAIAAVGMWISDGLVGAWLGFVAVVGGVSLAAHYGPLTGLVPLIAFAPPAVLFVLAWQHIRSSRAIGVFLTVTGLVLFAGGVAAQAAYDAVYGPSHPASRTAPPPDSPVTWMWAGATTMDGFTVVAGIDEAATADLVVWDLADGTEQVADTAPVEGGIVRLHATDLEPDTRYGYAIETLVGRGAHGSIGTFPTRRGDLVIAFSSCARLGSNGAVFDTIRALSPDLYVITGDFYYGDIGPNDLDAFVSAYEETLTRPAQAALYRSTSVAYVWDDHDYALNDAGGDAESRPAAMTAYRRFVPHYALAGDDMPIYQAFTIGRIRVVMTDLRSARSDRTILGDEQWTWFSGQLQSAATAGEVVLWVNTVPWITAEDPTSDNWGAFAEERMAISTLIDILDVDVVMLGGDAHMVAIDDGTNSAFGHEPPGITVFHAGALDRPGSLKGGPYSHGAEPGGGQFGLVEVSDDGTTILLRLSGLDWEGRVLVEYEVAFS